jgi:hypothetical protein
MSVLRGASFAGIVVCVALSLSLEALRDGGDIRGLLRHDVEASAAALMAGRHLAIIDSAIENGMVLAGLLADVASLDGACLGALSLPRTTARLLSLADLLVERFRDDLWLIIRAADGEALAQTAAYADQYHPAATWRAILVCRDPLETLMRDSDARARRDFAFITVR